MSTVVGISIFLMCSLLWVEQHLGITMDASDGFGDMATTVRLMVRWCMRFVLLLEVADLLHSGRHVQSGILGEREACPPRWRMDLCRRSRLVESRDHSPRMVTLSLGWGDWLL